MVGRKTYRHDIYIPVNGKVEEARQDRSVAKHDGQPPIDRSQGIARRSATAARKCSLSAPARRARSSSAEEAQRYLSQRAIRCEVLPTAQVVEAYNGSKQRKAALMHVTC